MVSIRVYVLFRVSRRRGGNGSGDTLTGSSVNSKSLNGVGRPRRRTWYALTVASDPMPDTIQSQTSKGVQGFPPLTFAGSGVLTPRRRAVLGASAWACTALQGGPGFNGGYLVKAAAAVHLGGRPGFRAVPGMPGARWPDRSARGGGPSRL